MTPTEAAQAVAARFAGVGYKTIFSWAGTQGRPLGAVHAGVKRAKIEADFEPPPPIDPPLAQALTYDSSTLRRMLTRLVVEAQRNIDQVPQETMPLEFVNQASLVVKRLIDANQALDRAYTPGADAADELERLRRNEASAAAGLEAELAGLRGKVRSIQGGKRRA